MRIGLAEKTVLVALGQAVAYAEKPKVASEQVQSSLEEVGYLCYLNKRNYFI